MGNQLRYSANRSHQIYPELTSILRKTVGLADVLVEALTPLAPSIDCAFVYGSVARGTEVSGSDVDVLIVGDVDFGTVVDVVQGYEKKIGREINPKVFSMREWKAKARSGDPFAREILEGPKIPLIGSEDELGKPRRRKS